MFIALLSFGGSLTTHYLSFSNEPCIARPTLIALNLVEVNYYSFIISLDEYNGSCNAFNDLSTKICVPIKTKDINVNVITRTNEIETFVKHIPCDCKYKFGSSACNSNQKLDNDNWQWELKV